MDRFFLALLLLLLAPEAFSQSVRAVAEDGRTVLLYEDGTWEEAEEAADRPPPPEPEVPGPPVSEVQFVGGEGAYQVAVNALRWRTEHDLIPGESEFGFSLPLGAGYGVTIYEISQIPVEAMRDIVLQTAQDGMGGVVTVLNEERVKVPGGSVLRLEYRVVTPQGLDITMTNSLHSDKRGTLQVITWTSTSALDRYGDELMDFQNSLVILPESR